MSKTVVLGAGMSGLVLAKELVKEGDKDIVLIDKELGGMHRELEYKGESFNPLGCFLFQDDGFMVDYLVGELDQSLHIKERDMGVKYGGKIFDYPFQSNLSPLPLSEKIEVLASFLKSRLFNDDFYSFEGWAEHKFGKKLANMMIIPHTKKKYGEHFSELDYEQFENKMQSVNFKDLVSSLFSSGTDFDLDKEFFSVSGGMGSVIDSLKESLIESGVEIIEEKVSKVFVEEKGVLIDGEFLDYDELYSTIPVNIFLELAEGINDIFVKASDFKFIDMELQCLMFDDIRLDANRQAVYFPDDEPFHRATYPKNYVKNWNKGFDVITFEIPNPDYLRGIDIIKDMGYSCLKKRKIKSAYPVVTKRSSMAISQLKKLLKIDDAYLFGRSAEFKYNYLPDIIKKAKRIGGAS